VAQVEFPYCHSVEQIACHRRNEKILPNWLTVRLGEGNSREKAKGAQPKDLLRCNFPNALMAKKIFHHEGHEAHEEKKRAGLFQHFVCFVVKIGLRRAAPCFFFAAI
jgi:hypothetical protein